MKHIQMSYSQEQMPEIIERDHRGTLIAKGLRVAFNLSGSVSIGYISHIKRNEWHKMRNGLWWSLKFELAIIHDDADKISIIKNPNSFVII